MQFVPAKKLLDDALQGKYAIPAFNIWNAETIDVVLKTAEKMGSPVIIATSPTALMLLPPQKIAPIAREIAKHYTVPAALHLDHGGSIEQVKDCIDAGYTSVMLDFSAKSFVENVRGVKEAVSLCRPRNISVEGEVGTIGVAGGTSEEHGGDGVLTDPEEARMFVEQTGVNMLAVGIGNAHGIYKSLPRFDFDRLKAIHDISKVPLVLHGGSGTPEQDVKAAISLGITKVNVATELVEAFRAYMLGQWTSGQNRSIALVTASALRKVARVVKKWIEIVGSQDIL